MGQITGINGVQVTSYGNTDDCVVAKENAIAFPVIVANTGITADGNGKKILKAGTPIFGDLTARNTPFVKATETGTPLVSNAVGVVTRDVDVTSGNQNAACLIFGIIKKSLTGYTFTAAEKAALNGKITVID